MNLANLAIGALAFLIIGLCHPLVVKMEYFFGKKIWWIFFVLGFISVFLSLFVNKYWSIILGIIGFSLFWSTIEIFKQAERVRKGQAKKNTNK